MRHSIAAVAASAVLLVAVQAVAQTNVGGRPDKAPAEAQSALDADVAAPWSGTVTSVNPGGSTFTCHGANGDRTYVTGPDTQIAVGNAPGSIADLKTGSRVSVVSHRSDDNTQDIADQVTIAQ